MIGDAELAALAEAAYADAPTWRAGDVHACLTELPDGPVIAFRGTEPDNLADVLRDLDALRVWRPALGWLDQGFIDGAEAVWPALREALAARAVVLTGHSLGGALALDTAGLMAAAGMAPTRVVTFGAPRVGGAVIRSVLGMWPVTEYVEAGDEVPDLPPWFEHVARAPVRIGDGAGDALACHRIARYRADVAALAAGGGA